MAFRLIPLLILFGTGVMGAIVVLNNITAPGANLAFVEHIMTMDTTNMDAGTQWREIRSPILHRIAFVTILLLETAFTVLCLAGSYFLAVNLGAPADAWERPNCSGTWVSRRRWWSGSSSSRCGRRVVRQLAVGKLERHP